jgi:hypothetical protein
MHVQSFLRGQPIGRRARGVANNKRVRSRPGFRCGAPLIANEPPPVKPTCMGPRRELRPVQRKVPG